MSNITPEACTPVIHMNGDDKSTILCEWDDFYDHIQKVIEVIPRRSFHGRNHYPKGQLGQDWSRLALMEIEMSLSKLRSVAEDVLTNLQK